MKHYRLKNSARIIYNKQLQVTYRVVVSRLEPSRIEPILNGVWKKFAVV